MKLSRTLVAAAAVSLVAVGVVIGSAYVAARPVQKKEVAPLRAGHVSIMTVMSKWKKWQSQAAAMNDRRAKAGVELASYRTTVEKKTAAMTAAAAAEKPKLEEELIDAQRAFEDAQRTARTELDQASEKILLALYRRCHEDVAAMAKELNLDVVYFCPATPQYMPDKMDAVAFDFYFRPTAMMPAYLKDGIDLTDELLTRVNRDK